MKRILSLLLALMMTFSLATVTFASVEDMYYLTFGQDKFTVASNGTVKVPVYVKGDETAGFTLGMISARITVPDGFALSDVEYGSLTSAANWGQTESELYMVFESSAYTEVFSSSAPLLTLVCTAPESGSGQFAITETIIWDYATDDYFDPATFVNSTLEVAAAPAVEVIAADETFETAYTANAYTATNTLAQFSLFAKVTGEVSEYGIVMGTEAFTKADLVAGGTKNIWFLEATAKNSEGLFCVTAEEAKAEDAEFKVLNTTSVWACAYAKNAAGEIILSDTITQYSK